MQFLKRQWAQIQAGLGGLSAEKKVIIGLLLVVMLTVLLVWLSWAGNSSRQPLPFAGDRADEVMASLSQQGIEAELRNGRIYVGEADQAAAVAVLWQQGLMTEDPSQAWAQLIRDQSPWKTHEQSEESGRIAVMNYSAGVIKAMRGVKDARVLLAPRPRVIFGQPDIRRTASVTVWMDSRGSIDQAMVEAIAAFVAAADAAMKPTDVSVVDGYNGVAHKVDEPEHVMPSKTAEIVAQRERQYKEKITELLAVPGLRVVVSVQVDAMQKQQSQEIGYQKETTPLSDESENTERTETTDAGEPGVRPNAGLSIDGGAAAGSKETITNSRTTFNPAQVTSKVDTLTVGHQTQKVNVSIGVPRAYFVSLHKARNPQTEGEPDDAALRGLMDEKLADFKSRVQPIIEADGTPGVVVAGVYEDAAVLAMGGTGEAGGGIAGSLGAVMGGPMSQPLIAGVLVMGVLAMMFYMVRRATRPESLPSIEELAGLPPKLAVDDDVVGEVDEQEDTMAGFELDEKELQSRKIAEQINELIMASPEEAGSLLGKWVKRDD